jgi:hypothetical protein
VGSKNNSILKYVEDHMTPKRYRPGTGELYLPYRYADGCFHMADPARGAVKHHAKNVIRVANEDDLTDHLRKGLHLRMIGTMTGQKNLISPKSIVFEE